MANIAKKIKAKECLLNKIYTLQINFKDFFYHRLFSRMAVEENFMNFRRRNAGPSHWQKFNIDEKGKWRRQRKLKSS